MADRDSRRERTTERAQHRHDDDVSPGWASRQVSGGAGPLVLRHGDPPIGTRDDLMGEAHGNPIRMP